MTTAAQPSELRRGWALIASAGTGVAFSTIVLPYYSLGALVVPVTEAFGWSRGEFQAAILFSTGLGALTAPAVGWLSDRYGSRPVALSGLLGLAVGFLLAVAMDGELWVLYLAYGSMALLGAGSIPVTWTRAITVSFFRQRGFALGLMLSGTGICGIFAPQYTTLLVEEFGWRAAYAGLALLPLLVALPIVYLGFRPHEPTPTGGQVAAVDERLRHGLTLAQAARTRRFWILLASILLVYMAISGIGPNLYPAITDAGMSPTEAASAQSLFGLAVIVGRLIVGFLVDRFWAPGVASIAIALPVLGSWLLIDPHAFLWVAVATFLIGMAAGAELDLMSFLAAKYFGTRHYAQIYSVLYMGLAVCSGFAPFLFATVYDVTASYAVGFSLSMGLFALASLTVLLLGRYPRLT